jgi:Zn finger protein HypA/HybF involved in hydrogenase expression
LKTDLSRRRYKNKTMSKYTDSNRRFSARLAPEYEEEEDYEEEDFDKWLEAVEAKLEKFRPELVLSPISPRVVEEIEAELTCSACKKGITYDECVHYTEDEYFCPDCGDGMDDICIECYKRPCDCAAGGDAEEKK